MFAGVACVAVVCFLIATFVDVEVHQKGLSVFMYLLALIPIIISVIMLMVLLYALYVMYTRRDNIKVTMDIKNKDCFEEYGVKLMPSDNYEWIVAEIKNKKGGLGAASGSKIKMGPKKDVAGASTNQTPQGLLGNLEGVNFE